MVLVFSLELRRNSPGKRTRSCAFQSTAVSVASSRAETSAATRKRLRGRNLPVPHWSGRGAFRFKACAELEPSDTSANRTPSTKAASKQTPKEPIEAPFVDSFVRAELGEDEDEDEDLGTRDTDPVLDRSRVFGAWLDNQVLEFERIQGAARQHPGRGRQKQAENAFAQGVQELNAGQYAKATDLIFRASALAGHQTRLGGEYLLWLAQALDAQGKSTRAQEVLRRLHYHRDSDVRRVAENLLYILQAPRLRLGPESFVQIDVEAICDPGRARDIPGWKKRQRRYRFGSGAAAALAGAGQRRKEPEKYSLEWFASQERLSLDELEQANQNSSAALVASSGVMFLILFLLRYLGH
ncbi:hypothetical protein CCYA_CCYA17G4271 [Cyanidiococcus yangmingshanensis]|nr:hypothetical protein CCYA_CCYA17G4271 [Cyanidiococcus yangmingshanensis]